MVTFRIISVGKPPGDWRSAAFEHYRKLLSQFATLDEVFVKEQQVTGSRGVEVAMKKEADALLKALTANAYCIALDRSGKAFSSIELARHFEDLFLRHSKFNVIIGGPYGLHDGFLSSIDEMIALSPMTFPHDLARVIITEQMYRVMAILNRLPYHK